MKRLVLVALVLVSCSSDSNKTASNCVPGAQVACACLGASTGVQECLGDGSGYGTCQCPDAGAGGQAGAGGTAGNAGASGQAGASGSAGVGGSSGSGGAGGSAGASGSAGAGGQAGAAGHAGTGGTAGSAGASGGAGSSGSAGAGGSTPSCPSDMVAIPAATFQMGSTLASDSQPVHSATVGAFCMDRTEVTVSAYGGCISAGACTEPDTTQLCNGPSKPNHPANCVDWNQARAYCQWAGKRLPTEAEWEFAAKGTEGREFPWGWDWCANCGCYGTELPPGTCEVGSYPSGASPFGVLDMAGNVWEWTSDLFCPYSQLGCSTINRTIRGGRFGLVDGQFLLTTDRAGREPSSREASIGIRCAK